MSQGSVIYPLFYDFFRDLLSSTEKTFVKDADDLTVCTMILTYLHTFKMNEFLSLIELWSVVNGLTPSPSMCQTVNFSLTYEQHLNTLLEPHKDGTIGDSSIKTFSKVIYLSVIFSSDLS